MQIINNQPQHDSPKNDQNSSSTPPNNQLNNKKHQQNNQSQQRRTAAERRASHRRRSTAQANELVQLAQLRKGVNLCVYICDLLLFLINVWGNLFLYNWLFIVGYIFRGCLFRV